MTAPSPSAERLYTLDTLRGVAALCVVFWHWQHFFYVGDSPLGFDGSRQPFFSALTPLYQYGGMAVQLFFSISGFVFFWLFSTGISKRNVTPQKFFWDRFSRLYPLHLVTFVLVALLQIAYLNVNSSYFVYPFNDGYHAVLNLFLAPAWGLEKGWSFNAPVWSVSIELLLYASFFLVCLAGRWRWLLALAVCGLGFMLYPHSYKIGSGVLCFYIGGLAFGLLEQLRRVVGSGLALVVSAAVALGAWIYQIIIADTVDAYVIMCLCFPASLAGLAAAGMHWPGMMRSAAWVGDISYSSYLLHFPLQILFALVLDGMGFAREIFYQPWVMLLFFAVLIPLSLMSHHCLERPAQMYLRSGRMRWGRKGKRCAPT